MPVDTDLIWEENEAKVLSMVAMRAASLSAGLLDIPNLTAAWIPARSYRTTGATAQQLDLVGGHDLTLNGTPTIAIQQNSKLYEAAYWNLVRASSMYLSRANESALAITNGFSFGVWISPTTIPTVGNVMGFIGKGTDALANRCWLTYLSNDTFTRFRVYDGGGVATDVVSTVGLTAGSWYFVQARFQGSTEMTIFVNGTKTTNTTAIPAAVRSTAGAFEIGSLQTGGYLDGKVGAAYLSASFLSDKTMIAIYNKTRVFYGV